MIHAQNTAADIISSNERNKAHKFVENKYIHCSALPAYVGILAHDKEDQRNYRWKVHKTFKPQQQISSGISTAQDATNLSAEICWSHTF
jgi:hypothetical protein